MAKDGLVGAICALAVLYVAPVMAQVPSNDSVAVTLAVQTALQQGRDFLQRGDARAAVQALEAQLGKVNGHPTYLNLLREAYRAHIKELRDGNQEPEAQRYLQRLQILDPGAALDHAAPPQAAAAKSPTPPPAPKPEVKLQMFHGEDAGKEGKLAKVDAKPKTGVLLVKADEEFAAKRYKEAASLYEQANQADPAAAATCKERWAYCKLHRVVEQINAPGAPPLADLERDVRQAMSLAPQLDYARTVLGEIEKRKGSTAVAGTVGVKHFEKGADGWARVETANFRIFHTQSKQIAEQAAQIAEKTRTDMAKKWFGAPGEKWEPVCELYLHATSRDYAKATGVAGNSPGHSSIKSEGVRIIGRRIDLHCDDAQNMLNAVLPHETTHVVIAGQYGDQPVPRWADEGIAVLTEPRDKIDRHLRNLTRCRQETGLFSARQLMTMNDYPEPRYISAFYAQSVALTDFLTNLKGPQVLTQFLRDAQKVGWEQALSKNYGFRNFEDLQQRWNAQAFPAEGVAAAGQ